MCPVMKWVSYRLLKALCEHKKFILIRSISCNKLLINPERTHHAPFVVISSEPYLCDCVEMTILGYLSWTDVTVIVKNGHVL